MKKMISWNVNGLRAAVGKNFKEVFASLDADIFCIQETKLQEGQIDLEFDGYKSYWNYAEKKGYSGTAIFTKEEPENVFYGINEPFYDDEGRVITLEFKNYFFLTCYTPNSQSELKRLEYRMSWEEKFLSYLKKLEKTKPVILCGDLNVAHKEIDLKNPKTNMGNAGFTNEEREKFGTLLDSGFIDTFRYFHPDESGKYSWWSYRFNARKNNAGWRIDYFLVSETLKDRLISADILSDIQGSDHCPVELVADI
ncbi:MAG: exodeoxyribonuclease III [Ruminococcus sp.]|nr:exodeoxyribonuclease III [Ruminococcus sp.]MDY3896380.1 exodeoxyribonuclease III [Candidatus Fimenecus sp.]